MKAKRNIIVVFYSHSNTTRKAAGQIKAAAGADIFELEPVDAYPSDYNTVVKQAKREIAEGFRPKLKEVPNISRYDVILLGSPNWWSTIAPPVASFLVGQDFAGKVIAPFITHGGGGLGRCAADIKKLCPASALAEAFNANQLNMMDAWLKSLDTVSAGN